MRAVFFQVSISENMLQIIVRAYYNSIQLIVLHRMSSSVVASGL